MAFSEGSLAPLLGVYTLMLTRAWLLIGKRKHCTITCLTQRRNWHNSSPTSGMDVNSTLSACLICRKVSYFVIPSVIWYSTKEEKLEIVDSYKAKLRSINTGVDFYTKLCGVSIIRK
ncbi:hypothetical protein ACSBR2_017926 [Camellia fascicularis]